MISVRNLSRSFGPIQAVKGISFSLEPGAITILAGADGAGKSTILKMILGLVKKDAGEIFLDGEKVGKNFDLITRITGFMPEKFSLYTDLSVEENLNFCADIHQVPRPRREEMKNRLLEKTGMLPFKKRRAGELSGGMKQKLSLSSILLALPQVLILDEPTTGVDPLSRIEFFNIIEELKQEGKTIVLATPYLDEAEKGDEIILIKEGEVLKKGPIASLKQKFPARLYRILPEGNILEVMQRLQADPEIGDDIYIRGRYIKYLEKERRSPLLDKIPSREVREETPTLEDIYLYYERKGQDARA